MRVIGGGSTESVVDQWVGEEGSVRKVLQPAAAALVAHEEVELPVRTKLHDAAIVVALFRAVIRAGMPSDCDVVGLARTQHDDVAIECQRRAIPYVAVEAIA